jgi:hypothetical protein
LSIEVQPTARQAQPAGAWQVQGEPEMTIGMIFYIIAAILFFLAAIGSSIAGPNAMTWGFFCIAVGLALDDFGFGFLRRR